MAGIHSAQVRLANRVRTGRGPTKDLWQGARLPEGLLAMSNSKTPPSTEFPLRLDAVLRLDRCPQCATALPHLTLKYIVDAPMPGRYDWWIYWAIYRCESCGNIVAAKSENKGHIQVKNK